MAKIELHPDFKDFLRLLNAHNDGILINFISLQDLKKNKHAAGRHKDMDDLEHLP